MKEKSDSQLILELLEDGNIETRKTIDRKIGTLKGPSRVSDLRKEGYEIDDRTIESRHGRRVSAYYMPKKIEPEMKVLYCLNCLDIEKVDSSKPNTCSECGEDREICVKPGKRSEVA